MKTNYRHNFSQCKNINFYFGGRNDVRTFASQISVNVSTNALLQIDHFAKHPNTKAEMFRKELDKLVNRFPATLYYSINGEWVIKTTPQYLVQILTILKKHTPRSFSQLRDITAIDYSERKLRFEIVYFLLSVSTAQRVSVSVSVGEGISIPSVVSIYPSAGWYERETWDRFGVFFRNHPDLRRRLTDYGFKGHPLRKDFPLTGYVEVRYDDFRKRILYEGVSLAQEYRIFTLENPWKL